MKALAGLLRAYARLLTRRGPRVPVTARIGLAVLFVPVFSLFYVLLKVHVRFRGPVVVDATTLWGSRVTARMPDLIQMYVYLFGIWEPDLSAFILRRLSPGDTFIDVGANIGYHALLAGTRLAGEGRVVAIEPSPAICADLRDNLALNGNPGGVRVVERAASDAESTVRLYRGPVHNVGLSTTVEGRGLELETEVGAAPLAELLEPGEIRTARLVKIDVEGAEDRVLRGMAGFLERCPRHVEILVELSPTWWSDRQQVPQQVLQPFLDAGFNVYAIDNNMWPWRFLWPDHVRPPRRLRRALTRRVNRLDLVLSREDAQEL